MGRPRCGPTSVHGLLDPTRAQVHEGRRRSRGENRSSRASLLENLRPSLFHLVSIYSKPPLIPAASHHLQPMAGQGNPKTVATTPAATRLASPPPSGALNPAAEAMLEDEATFVQPLAMVLAEGSSGGPMGATHRSADQPGRPTRERDIHRHCSAAWSPLPLKIVKSRAHA